MKKILISADAYETKAALVEGERVVETYIERDERRSLLGNIYLAKVDTVLPGMEAAFVDAGMDKNAFLHVAEIRVEGLDQRARRSKRIQDLVKGGQSLLVQVIKDPMGTKGARVTMDVSLAGRFLVYVPDGEGGGVSKRLSDGERDRLRELVKQLKPRLGGGLIVRTAAKGAELAELERDLALLEDQWETIRERIKTAPAPSLVHGELDIALQLVRDDFRQDVDELIVDDQATYDRIVSYVQERSPELVSRVHQHQAQTELLRRYGVDEAIESTLRRRVDLPSGGYLLFDYAEAFTIVDVNTGRFVGKKTHEETVLKTNLEAARVALDQLRLRNIGGIIIIDFIDMEKATNRKKVSEVLAEAVKRDKARTNILRISELGLVQMTRKRTRDNLRHLLTAPCPTCHGDGRLRAVEALAADALRAVRRALATSPEAKSLRLRLPGEVARALLGPLAPGRQEFQDRLGVRLEIEADERLGRGHSEIHILESAPGTRPSAPKQGDAASATTDDRAGDTAIGSESES